MLTSIRSGSEVAYCYVLVSLGMYECMTDIVCVCMCVWVH